MKSRILSVLLVQAVTATLLAESPIEREFKQLREQRDKTIAAAIDPINRKYQVSLDQLLRRATQTNDLETALKIKQEMGASAITATTTPTAKSETTANKIKTKKQWEDYLTNSAWKMVQAKTNTAWGDMTFKERGVVDFNKEHKWAVTNAGKVTVAQFTLEFSVDMRSFTVVWGGSGELIGTLKTEAK